MPRVIRHRKTADRDADAALNFAALTPARWPDIEHLFGPNGACGGCWCMWWKQGRTGLDPTQGSRNKRAFQSIVKRGDEPGFLAYRNGLPVAWCAVEPRERYPALARSRLLAAVDDKPVWSITCLFIRAGHRRQGLSAALLEHAKRFVAERGGRLIEGYPKDGFRGANSTWTGVFSTFTAAGFTEVERRAPSRPIVRIAVDPRGT